MASQRVTIGFTGTQMLAVRIEKDSLEGLLGALKAGGWYDLAIDDGVVLLDLGQVVYVRTEHDDQRVGFGLSS